MANYESKTYNVTPEQALQIILRCFPALPGDLIKVDEPFAAVRDALQASINRKNTVPIHTVFYQDADPQKPVTLQPAEIVGWNGKMFTYKRELIDEKFDVKYVTFAHHYHAGSQLYHYAADYSRDLDNFERVLDVVLNPKPVEEYDLLKAIRELSFL